MYTDRQLEIIQASYQLISWHGIQGLTIKNLAERIGVTEPAIYRHYKNKVEILVSILDYFYLTYNPVFSKISESEANSIDKIRTIFLSLFEAFIQNPTMVAVIFSEEIFRNQPMLTAKLETIMESNSQIIKTIIESGQQNDEITNNADAAHLATIILGALRLHVKKWHMKNNQFDLLQTGMALFENLKLLIQK